MSTAAGVRRIIRAIDAQRKEIMSILPLVKDPVKRQALEASTHLVSACVSSLTRAQ